LRLARPARLTRAGLHAFRLAEVTMVVMVAVTTVVVMMTMEVDVATNNIVAMTVAGTVTHVHPAVVSLAPAAVLDVDGPVMDVPEVDMPVVVMAMVVMTVVMMAVMAMTVMATMPCLRVC